MSEIQCWHLDTALSFLNDIVVCRNVIYWVHEGIIFDWHRFSVSEEALQTVCRICMIVIKVLENKNSLCVSIVKYFGRVDCFGLKMYCEELRLSTVSVSVDCAEIQFESGRRTWDC